MRIVFAVAACALLVSGCEGMKEKVHDSRQEICGDLYQPGPYQEGLREGLARRPRPPV